MYLILTFLQCSRLTANALYLFHHLVQSDESFELRPKLLNAHYKRFNGLLPNFTVMISRLSYADAPDWPSEYPSARRAVARYGGCALHADAAMLRQGNSHHRLYVPDSV